MTTNEHPDLDELLSPAEVAAFLKVARRTVGRYLASGALPHARIGHRTVRVRRRDALAFLAERTLR